MSSVYSILDFRIWVNKCYFICPNRWSICIFYQFCQYFCIKFCSLIVYIWLSNHLLEWRKWFPNEDFASNLEMIMFSTLCVISSVYFSINLIQKDRFSMHSRYLFLSILKLMRKISCNILGVKMQFWREKRFALFIEKLMWMIEPIKINFW